MPRVGPSPREGPHNGGGMGLRGSRGVCTPVLFMASSGRVFLARIVVKSAQAPNKSRLK
jgi:hypothetical protein